MRKVLATVVALGGVVTPTRGGHWRVRGPDGVAVLSGTPSGPRWWANARADLRRIALDPRERR